MARGNWLSRGKGKGKHQGPRRVDMAWESEKEKMHKNAHSIPSGQLSGQGKGRYGPICGKQHAGDSW